MSLNEKYSQVNPIQIAWLLREDLRKGKSADRPISKDFYMWWLTNGAIEYPKWKKQSLPYLNPLIKKNTSSPYSFSPFGINPLLKYLYKKRKDLQSAFDISTIEGQQRLIAWFFIHGLKEYRLQSLCDEEIISALDSPCQYILNGTLATSCQDLLITNLMYFVWILDEGLQRIFPLKSELGRVSFVGWFINSGVSDLSLQPIISTSKIKWLKEEITINLGYYLKIQRFALFLWFYRKDLQDAFDITTYIGGNRLTNWSHEALQIEKGLKWLNNTSYDKVNKFNISRKKSNLNGVNLIGFARGELGIGEDVRMAALACESVGIPYTILNINPGNNVRQKDFTLQKNVVTKTEQCQYDINIFCLTAFDTSRVYLEIGPRLFQRRYNIGWWPWELPVWPRHWRCVFEIVNEIWAATEFTKSVYSDNKFNKKPVILMPLPVTIDNIKKISRRKIKLPKDKTIFLYIFDFNSYLKRKNPFAVLKSFRTAFSEDDESVYLVFKTMNSNRENPHWKSFLKQCNCDKRVIIIDKSYNKGAVIGLINLCDIYISLHRSEGFGRTLAEAMLLGKPVVATDFSGNRDFLNNETGFPVKWKKCKVHEGDYPFITDSDNAWWAEPDTKDASLKIKEAYLRHKDIEFRRHIENFAQNQFSPLRIGYLIKERLEIIRKSLNLQKNNY